MSNNLDAALKEIERIDECYVGNSLMHQFLVAQTAILRAYHSEQEKTVRRPENPVEPENPQRGWRVEAGAEVWDRAYQFGLTGAGSGVVQHVSNNDVAVLWRNRTLGIRNENSCIIIKPAVPEEGDFVRTHANDAYGYKELTGVVVGECCNSNFGWRIQCSRQIQTRQRNDFTVICKGKP